MNCHNWSAVALGTQEPGKSLAQGQWGYQLDDPHAKQPGGKGPPRNSPTARRPNTHTPSHNQTRQILANFLPRGTDQTFPRTRVRRKVPFNRQPVAMIRQKSRWISHFFAEKSVASRSKQKSSFQSVPRRASIFQQRPINNSLHYQLGGGRFSGRKQSRRLF